MKQKRSKIIIEVLESLKKKEEWLAKVIKITCVDRGLFSAP